MLFRSLKEVADEITAAGGEVYAVSTDISKPEDPEMLMHGSQKTGRNLTGYAPTE